MVNLAAAFTNVSKAIDFSVKVDIPAFIADHSLVQWGILPYLAANVGFWTAVIILELVIKVGCCQSIECTYCFLIGFGTSFRSSEFKKN